MKFAAILFDFDGVLIESEAVSSRHVAETLTRLGHPMSAGEAIAAFTGLAQPDFFKAVASHIGRDVPEEFHAARTAEDHRAISEGVDPVAGAITFVRSLPADLPIAVVSSSTTKWLHAHLAHIGLADRFGTHVYSGREHVTRGKPAPDLYLLAAAKLGIDIDRIAIIEDSAIGVTGATASGAFVIGLTAASHCAPGHAETLLAKGASVIAGDFGAVAHIVGLA